MNLVTNTRTYNYVTPFFYCGNSSIAFSKYDFICLSLQTTVLIFSDSEAQYGSVFCAATGRARKMIG